MGSDSLPSLLRNPRILLIFLMFSAEREVPLASFSLTSRWRIIRVVWRFWAIFFRSAGARGIGAGLTTLSTSSSLTTGSVFTITVDAGDPFAGVTEEGFVLSGDAVSTSSILTISKLFWAAMANSYTERERRILNGRRGTTSSINARPNVGSRSQELRGGGFED